MNKPPTSQDIRRWYPQKWTEIVGNRKIIQQWLYFLVNGMCNALFTGPSRTGKTRAITLGIKAMMCTNRTQELNPCGICLTCRALDEERHCHSHIFSALTGSDYTFKAIDCKTVAADELKQLHTEVNLDDPKTIIYLDEVDGLKPRGLEDLILKPSDESHAIWLASAIKVNPILKKGKVDERKSLSVPLQGRFPIKVGTTLPGDIALTRWIKDRSREWQIVIENEEVSIPMMIRMTNRRVGYVIHILSAAVTRGRRIHPDWLGTFNIGAED